MANHKVKVPVIGTVGKTVFIDPSATRGATLGMDVFTPDGIVGTPNTVRAWLGLTLIPPAGVEDDEGSGTQHHRLLMGLTLGDDHPQYTQWIQDEHITGAWVFENTLTIDINGGLQWVTTENLVDQTVPLRVTHEDGIYVQNPDSPGAGIEITANDIFPDTSTNATIWFREVSFADAGFRLFLNGNDEFSTINGFFSLFAHNFSASGTEVWRANRNPAQLQLPLGTVGNVSLGNFDVDGSNTGIYFPTADSVALVANGSAGLRVFQSLVELNSQMQGGNGTATVPTYSFLSGNTSGWYRVASQHIGLTVDGALRFSVNSSALQTISTLVWTGPDGTNLLPAFTFTTDPNTGMYRIGSDQLGFATNGVLRLSILTSEIVSTLRLGVADGDASTPGYGFGSDIDNGMFLVAGNTLGFSSAGTERLRFNADGAWGLSGANFGTEGQVLTSHGSAAPPTFEDQSGGGGGGGALVYVNTTIEAGDTIANTASELAFDASYNIPANTLTAGSVVRVRVFGTYSTDAVPPTLRLRLKLDTTTVLDSGAVQTIAFDGGWMLEAQLVAQTGGATGDLEAQGWMELETTGDTGQVVNLENSSPFTVDMTQGLVVTLTAQWSGADTDNSITLRQMAIWIDEAAVAPTAAAPASATYLTEDDETADLPNSRQLLAGGGIDFDDSVGGERTISATAALGDLATEILADSPLGYWKLDEASGNFADSSGNGRTMTAAGSPSYQYGGWVPNDSVKYVYFDANGDGATRTDSCGLTIPANADWTFECVGVITSVTTNVSGFFGIGGGNETEAQNYQVRTRFIATTGLMSAYWENGAGTDNNVNAAVAKALTRLGEPAHYAWVKDGTANTVTFYINGQLMDVIGYANEPTGGTTITSQLGANDVSGTTVNPCGIAHAALYNTALSQARIRVHAKAAGFLLAD